MPYQPSQYREKSVNRFVPVLKLLLADTGKSGVSFDPFAMLLSPNTAIARLRDAVHAISSGKVIHPSINADLLREVWSQYKITSDGSIISISPRQTEERPQAVPTGGSRAATELAVLKVSQPRFVETLTAFACLLGQRILTGEVTIYGDLSSTLIDRLENDNDVVIKRTGEQQYIML